MTEQQAIKILQEEKSWESDDRKIDAFIMGIEALEEIQKYRAIENELKEKYHANVDIKGLIEYFIETIFKGDQHEGFCILTNEDAKMWDECKTIGTIEECRTAVERMKPKTGIVRKGGVK